MRSNVPKKLVSFLLSLVFVCSQTGHIYAETVSKTTYRLSDGITYSEEKIVDSGNNRQTAFVVEYDPSSLYGSIEFLTGKNLNSRNTVTELVKSSADLYEGNAVAAMNADFFNMSTGLCESIFIQDGVMLTSDRDNYSFAFDKDGIPFIDKPTVSMLLDTPYKQYTVLHFNKEFTEYGLYLYSPHYGETTRIKVPSVELVLTPYADMRDYTGICELMYGEGNAPFDLEIQNENADGSVDVEINVKYKSEIEEYALQNGYVEKDGKFYIPAQPEAILGSSVSSYISEIRNNSAGESLKIPEGSFVLAANASTQAFKFENLKVGDSLKVTFNCNERFVGAEKAIGCGAMIVNNSKVVENTNQAHYFAANPRTAIGITSDSKVIMLAVDGRQSGYSKGYTLKELSEEMIRRGCVTAANFDGGGSTVVKAYLPGSDGISTVSVPSDGSERKVSNAVGFYNLGTPDGSKTYSYLNPKTQLVLSNGKLELGKAYFADAAFYPSGVSQIKKSEETDDISGSEAADDENEALNKLLEISAALEQQSKIEEAEKEEYDYLGFTYTVDEGKGSISEGVYSPDGYTGNVIVVSNSPDGAKNDAVQITSLAKVDKITVTGDKSYIYVGDTLDFTAKATYKGFEVAGDDYCFSWETSVGDKVKVDGNGVVRSNEPVESVKITASFADTSGEAVIEVRQLPFSDIAANWAKDNIIFLYEKGISNGEITSSGRMYFPSRSFTRNEFCVMLSRLLGLTEATDNHEKNDEEEKDNVLSVFADCDSIPDWAYDEVKALFSGGYLEGFEHAVGNVKKFDGSEYVTRREVIRLLGKLLNAAPADYTVNFSDVSENDADLQSIKNSLYNGVFNGYLDGTLRPDADLTRAEVSAVFARAEKLLNKE